MDDMSSISISVDKSHLITIGERLYVESLDLIRELVNNAYDADATIVDVLISTESIVIKDNGSGMNLNGLKQYFTIGSQEKKQKSKSKIFNRDQIGQFGIGKFASLSACETFIVETQKESFAAEVIFNKSEWSTEISWSLPLRIKTPCVESGNGTTVTLKNLRKTFNIQDIENKIVESCPIKAESFEVRLNGHPILPKSLTGHRIPIFNGSLFGIISGEIVIIPQSAVSISQYGIEVKVKQVTVKRELFGMETWGQEMLRVQGEINADFLPVTSDRSGFITDSDEYKEFLKAMAGIIQEIRLVLGRLSNKGERRKASRALNEALSRIYRALSLNPEYSPMGAFPEAKKDEKGIGGAATQAGEDQQAESNILPSTETKQKPEKPKKPKVKRLTQDAVVKKLKIGDLGISFCLDHFGEEGQESFHEGSTIYINIDTPLYQRESKNQRAHTMHIARLLTQEIALMKDPRNPRQAFEKQGRLLRDAFSESA